MKPFMKAYALNSATANAIDDEVDEWHSRADDWDSKPELHEFLGMTGEQYARWVKDPSCLDEIATEYVEANSLIQRMMRGDASAGDLDAAKAEHAASGTSIPMHVFLGLTQDELDAIDAGSKTVENVKQERMRVEALTTAFDVLTSYLTDACPDEENWEDFDGDVDAIRMQIDEALRN